MNNLNIDTLRVDTLLLSSTTPVVDHTVAITDYLSTFSESAVANIAFFGEPIFGVTLEPANASISIDGLLINALSFTEVTLYAIKFAQFLSLDLVTLSTL